MHSYMAPTWQTNPEQTQYTRYDPGKFQNRKHKLQMNIATEPKKVYPKVKQNTTKY